tara:strand:+ start:205 stop:507 length:303 start_codon:yes stop_codon:yes gene_type:complete
MAEAETISWIFLSIALASQTETADLKEISNIADGINHSIPKEKEMQTAISWLLNERIICKIENKYQLTNLGKSEYGESSKNTKTLFGIWKNLELRIKNMN